MAYRFFCFRAFLVLNIFLLLMSCTSDHYDDPLRNEDLEKSKKELLERISILLVEKSVFLEKYQELKNQISQLKENLTNSSISLEEALELLNRYEKQIHIEEVVIHFLDISLNFNGSDYNEPLRWKSGIKIFIHNGMPQSERSKLLSFVKELDGIIENDEITFNFVQDTVNANFFVMSGNLEEFNNYWGFNFNNNFVGSAVKFLDPNDCSGLNWSKLWYTTGSSGVMEHEVLHGLGLYHSTYGRSIMFPSPPNGGNLLDIDREVLFLLYHPELLNEYYECGDADNILTEQEIAGLKDKLYTILENR